MDDRKLYIKVQNYQLFEFISDIGGFGTTLFGGLLVLTRMTSRILFMNSVLGQLFLAHKNFHSHDVLGKTTALFYEKEAKFCYQDDCKMNTVKFRCPKEAKSYDQLKKNLK